MRRRVGRWGLWLMLASGLAARAQQVEAPVGRPSGPGEDVFMKAVPSSKAAYAGQALTVSYLLYYAVPVIDPDADIDLKFKNCEVEEYPATARERRETLAGKTYQVRVLKQYHVVPELEGTLTLPVLTRQYSFRAPPSPEDFFGEPKIVSKTIRSGTVKVPVRPLPPAPDSLAFANMLGQFRFRPSYTVSRKSANLLTFRLKITGAGNLKKAKLLPAVMPAGVDVFNIAGEEKHVLTAQGLRAEYTYSYDVLANYQGTYVLPGIRVLSFDPKQEKYSAYRAPAYTWRVDKGPVAPAPEAAKPAVVQAAPRAWQAKTTLFQDEDKQLFFGSRTYYGCLLVAAGLLLAGVAQAERLKRRAANPRRYKARTAKSRALKALRRIALPRASPTDAHYKNLGEILLGYLCARFDLDEANFSLRDLPARLQARGVPAVLQHQTADFLRTLTKIRFSGGPPIGSARSVATDELIALITRLDACSHDEIPTTLVPVAR
ncbi:hypothetical protein MUN81_15835 [Hymenobacter sp. 5317J-9]|uniref:hypothetical protein n=1 Tax=Hymenobacter sp. 5317J-9 TaxID=2932250 RepID=UPI001FD65BEF|nr:hypothetical protein [Hymenobacter sp. 5317J-9]UOQ96706.1 hypothetical protein MUN81_15835 [Hymenobacter sp. 5317J-9]